MNRKKNIKNKKLNKNFLISNKLNELKKNILTVNNKLENNKILFFKPTLNVVSYSKKNSFNKINKNINLLDSNLIKQLNEESKENLSKNNSINNEINKLKNLKIIPINEKNKNLKITNLLENFINKFTNKLKLKNFNLRIKNRKNNTRKYIINKKNSFLFLDKIIIIFNNYLKKKYKIRLFNHNIQFNKLNIKKKNIIRKNLWFKLKPFLKLENEKQKYVDKKLILLLKKKYKVRINRKYFITNIKNFNNLNNNLNLNTLKLLARKNIDNYYPKKDELLSLIEIKLKRINLQINKDFLNFNNNWQDILLNNNIFNTINFQRYLLKKNLSHLLKYFNKFNINLNTKKNLKSSFIFVNNKILFPNFINNNSLNNFKIKILLKLLLNLKIIETKIKNKYFNNKIILKKSKLFIINNTSNLFIKKNFIFNIYNPNSIYNYNKFLNNKDINKNSNFIKINSLFNNNSVINYINKNLNIINSEENKNKENLNNINIYNDRVNLNITKENNKIINFVNNNSYIQILNPLIKFNTVFISLNKNLKLYWDFNYNYLLQNLKNHTYYILNIFKNQNYNIVNISKSEKNSSIFYNYNLLNNLIQKNLSINKLKQRKFSKKKIKILNKKRMKIKILNINYWNLNFNFINSISSLFNSKKNNIINNNTNLNNILNLGLNSGIQKINNKLKNIILTNNYNINKINSNNNPLFIFKDNKIKLLNNIKSMIDKNVKFDLLLEKSIEKKGSPILINYISNKIIYPSKLKLLNNNNSLIFNNTNLEPFNENESKIQKKILNNNLDNILQNKNLIYLSKFNNLINTDLNTKIINIFFNIYNTKLNNNLSEYYKEKRELNFNNELINNLNLNNLNNNLNYSQSLNLQNLDFNNNYKFNISEFKFPILNKYLNSISFYSNKKNIKGTLIYFNKIVGYIYNTKIKQNLINKLNNKYIYLLLNFIFKSIYCLISKPVFLIQGDKIIIRLFYFLLIPNFLKNKKFKKNNYYKKKLFKFKNNKFSRNLNQINNKNDKQNFKLVVLPDNNSLNINNNDNINNSEKLKISNAKIKLNRVLLNKKLLKLKKSKNNIKTSYNIKQNNMIKLFEQKFKSIFELKLKPFRKKRLIKFYFFNFRKKIKLINLSMFSIINNYPNKFKILTYILNKYLFKNIELDFVRLHYPYLNSNILVNLIGYMINKIKIRIISRKLFRKAVIKKINNKYNEIDNNNNNKNKVNKFNNKENLIKLPSFITGIKIKIGGRLMNYKSKPRKTVRKIQRGISSIGKVNYTDFARYTKKNKKGAFSITISSGQNLFV